MPSLRVLAVVLLVGMGATVAAVGEAKESGESDIPARAEVGATQRVPSTPSGPQFDVRAENRKPGTRGWRISRAQGTSGDLAGYAGTVSVRPGQPVPLSVRGNGPIRIRALRIGWYGGVGARQVWQGTVRAQSEAIDPRQWPVRGLVDTTGWPEGHYLLRLDQGDASRYLPLTVRSADNRGRTVVLTSPMTWVAENTTSLAENTTSLAENTTTVLMTAAGGPKLSFDRPYVTGYGSAGFLKDDAGIIEAAERTGHRIGFATDYDVATDPSLIIGASAVLTGGDSQYWTASLRSAITTAAETGTNLAFFGAGTGARRVRLVDAGRALQISQAKPSASVRITGLRPSCSRDARAETTEGAGWVVSNADWWGYRGTGVRTDDVLPGLVAGRVDRAATTATGSPEPMQVLAYTQVGCGSVSQTVAHAGVYQSRPSGAGVFAAGTSRWACALTRACGAAVPIDAATVRVLTRVTRNVINAFAEAGAGRRFIARDSASQYAGLR